MRKELKPVEFDPSNPLKLREMEEGELKGDEELLLEQDLEGNKKRNRKNIDTTQYNDDSSDDYSEEEDEWKPQKQDKLEKRNGGDDDDDDDSDMFSSKDEDESKPKPKKPKVQLLDVDELEKELEVDKNIFQAHREEEENDDDDKHNEEEVAADFEYYNNQEEAHFTKVHHEPKLDAFNLKAEQNSGRFDADGNYIALDDSENEDEFLIVKKKDIKRAREAQLKRERQEVEKRSLNGILSTETILELLISMLKPVESSLEALQRLNKAKLKKKGKRITLNSEEMEKERKRLKHVTDITEFAEVLIEKGIKDAYELEREELMLKYREETGRNYKMNTQLYESKTSDQQKEVDTSKVTNEAIKPELLNEETKWEFRWIGDSQVYGPHTTNEIRYWKDNFFQSKVEIRPVGTVKFHHIDNKSF